MLRVLSFTEKGDHRANEDALLTCPHRADPACLLVCLADGQGGRAGGARAARLACKTLLAAAAACPVEQLVRGDTWMSLIRRADEAVAADAEAGFTTLVGCCVCRGALVGASGGDSAVFVWSGGRVEEPTRRQHKDPPVGSGAAFFVPFVRPLQQPWRVLAMSDGVWKYGGADRLRELIAAESGRALLDAITAAGRLPGSGKFADDFTLALVEET